MRKRLAHWALGILAVVGLAGVCVQPSVAGDEPPPSLTCTIAGETILPADTAIYDAGSGGNVVAKLTGASIPFTLSSFPAKLETGRVKIGTSKGGKNVRIDGFADLKGFRFFAAQDLPVTGASGVWITKGQQLRLVSANGKGFVVEKSVVGSKGQKVQASVGCGAVSVEIQAIEDIDVPKRARTFQMKNDSIELFDKARGDLVFKLEMQEEARKVFWSTETRQGYVRVMSRADITIDAWARIKDVSYLRHAELFDMSSVSPKPLAARQLAIQDPPKPLTATSELPIHRKPENALHGIGTVEVGAKFYAMEKSGDWTNIMPETLAVLPPDGAGFWVRTAGLPSLPPAPKPDK